MKCLINLNISNDIACIEFNGEENLLDLKQLRLRWIQDEGEKIGKRIIANKTERGGKAWCDFSKQGM